MEYNKRKAWEDRSNVRKATLSKLIESLDLKPHGSNDDWYEVDIVNVIVCCIRDKCNHDDLNDKIDVDIKSYSRWLAAHMDTALSSSANDPKHPCNLFFLTRSLMLACGENNGCQISGENTGLYLNMRRDLYGENVLDGVRNRLVKIKNELKKMTQ